MDVQAYRTTTKPFFGQAFFTIMESQTTGPFDSRPYTRHSVAHPGAVAVVPVIGDHVFCVEQYRPAVQKVLIEVPAGRPEANERAEETAHRELREETGLDARELVRVGTVYGSPSFSDVEITVFVATRILPPGRVIRTRPSGVATPPHLVDHRAAGRAATP
jgi:ADP-ribose pyrophosphatase